MKVLSHPGHGNSKCCIVRELDVFQILDDISPLVQKGSSVLINWRGEYTDVYVGGGGQNNLSVNEWHNTRGPNLCCPLTSEGGRSFLWGQQCKHLGQRRRIVWKRSKRIHLCQTGTTFFEQRRWSTALLITHPQCSTEFPPSLRSPSTSNPQEGRLDQQHKSVPRDSETGR